ncbi:MAG TPA: ABC transporter ATP-binding protein [Candidatus Onthocola stercorigallinarum]|nr:ABC transporter ATP-binding protein [Candidatus Onthocola stercorigallinarum]
MKFFKTVISSFKHTKLLIVIFFVLSILLNYLTTYIPVVIQYFIDVLLNQDVENHVIEFFISLFNSKISFIPIICILLLIVEGIIVLSTYIRTIVKSKIIQEFQFELKLKLFNHIQNLTYQDFYQKSLSDLVQNSTDDVNNIVNFIEKQLTYIFDIILIIIFAITQLINLDFRLSSIMIVAVSIIIILSIWYFKKSKPIIDKRIKLQKEMYDDLDNNYSNIKFMKVNNLQNKEKERFREINIKNFEANKNKVILDSWYKTLIGNIVRIQTPFIFILSSFLYAQGFITIGSIYVTINYSNKVTRAFTDLADILEFFNLCMTSYERLNNLLDLTLEDKEIENKDIKIKNTTITFKNASIKVNSKVILSNLNFTINPNEKVMIVGSTGSGKSILLKTLVGFYDYEGSIKIGEYEVRDLNKKMIRENICLLLQDSYLFSKTIAENIRILVPQITYPEIIELSNFFSFHKDVIKFNDGYDTKIGRNGIVLSKGQKQRLVLIRAYTKPKPIMIFDDSFSAIDKINKKKILNNLMLLEDNSTKIIITHDIGLAPHFKKIIFINNGQAICGTHEELLKNKNYRKVYDLNLNKLGEEYA